MTKKFKRILCAALAMMMTSSLATEGILRGVNADVKSGVSPAAVAATDRKLNFTNVTGQFDTSKIVTENFNSSVLENTDASSSTESYREHTVIVSLKGDGMLSSAKGADLEDFVHTKKGEEVAKNIKARQDAFLSALQGKKIPYKLVDRFSAVDNAVAIQVNTRYVSTIKQMSGVRGAVLSQTYSRPESVVSYAATADGGAVTNETTVYKTGIYDSSAFADKYAGEGMVVAILDTGLDYTHEAFQTPPKDLTKLGLALDSTDVAQTTVTSLFAEKQLRAEERTALAGGNLTAKDVYISAKVPFAYDYADDDNDVYPAYSNHGTHVAGIIGGSADSYTNKDGVIEEDENGPIPFVGVAPESQLVICKVFTDDLDSKDLGGAVSEDILAALEDCVMLGVDIINMSLGTTAGFTFTDDGDDEGEYLSRVYESIQDAGISLMAAASNDYSANYGSVFGTNKASNPDSGVIGSPSTYPAAMSVASISGQPSEYLMANVGTDYETPVFYYESSDENSVLYDFLDQVLGKEGTPGAKESATFEYVVVPNYGTAADYTAIKSLFNGGQRFALVSRGDNTFKDKVDIAAKMGAAGIIVYNNVAGMIRMNLGEVQKVIPAISINLEAGRALRSGAVRSVGKFTVNRSEYKAGPFMSDFSSWGATPDLRLKPEITAHGGEITSTVPGGYDEQSGTSMATPNMAGFMALARSYVEREMAAEVQRVMDESGCSKAQAITRLVNQLTMSTAVTARDQKGLPYSPRKQGAGLANLSNVIGGTSAYLWTSNEGNDYRPKIELFDKHFSKNTVTYTLDFNITNFGQKELSFSTKTIAMTEKLALDGFAVAEEAYILEKCQQSAKWTVTGDATYNNGTLTVGAGKTGYITVEITLDESEKEYIEKTFVNGMYVEGFLQLESTTDGQCSLAIPYMGFYGDWTAAPMLDYSVYEIAEAEQDASIDDALKPQASVYATQPFTAYYNEKYILPMGGYVYLLPDDAEPMYADMDKSSVSRYNEYYSEDGVDANNNSNYMTSTRIQAVYAGLLRNAKYVNYQLVDEYTGEVIHTDVINRVGKAYNGGQSSGVPGNVKLELVPEDYDLVANGKYRMDFEFFLDYNDGVPGNKNTFSFTFYVDYESPQLEDVRVRYSTYTEAGKEKQKIYLDLDVYDNHYPQSVMLCYLSQDGMLEDGVTPKRVLQLATDYITPIRDSVRADKTTVSIEITDIYEKYGSQLYVQVDDYSLNNSLYVLDLTQANANILPDSFELKSDGKMTLETEKGKTVGKLTLDVYETYKAKLDYEGMADLSNFTWKSLSPSIVGVKNGEIVGLRKGEGRIQVQNQKGDSKDIYVTVTDTVKPLSTPSISFGTVEETRYKAILKAKGVLNVFAGKEFQLTVESDPWYYPLDSDGKYIQWQSMNPDYATVDQEGNVKTLKEGLATILGYLMNADGTRIALASVVLNIEEEFLVSNFTLTEYNGVGWNEEIPDENGNLIKALVIPTDMNIMYIGEEAFKNDTSIEYVVIPETVVQIQQDAFENCTNLKKVYFISTTANEIATSKLTLIHDQAFRACTSLERFDLSNVKKITVARQTFMNCTNLKEVVKMTAIGTMHSEAFIYCTSLEEADITGLHMSGSSVFYGCTSLSEVKTAKFTEIGDSMFYGCSSLKSVTINNPKVGAYAFGNCKNLESVTFASPAGESLAFTVGDGAFSGCSKLSSVNFGNETVRSIGANAFAQTALSSFTLPAGLESLGGDVFSRSQVTEIVLSDGFDLSAISLTGAPFRGLQIKLQENSEKYKIENGALYTADGEKLLLATKDATGAFTVPAGVKEIGEYAFAYSAITSVSIPATVEKIGEGAFMGSSLATIAFADADNSTLGAIEAETFRNTQLTGISLPASVQSVGDYAFAGSKLTSFAFTGDTLGEAVFASCKFLENIVLYDGITKMGSNTFNGCTKLKTVVMPSVTELGVYTFNGATALESVTFGENATTIGTATFSSYSMDYETFTERYVEVPNLKTVVMPTAISEIPMNTFYWCTGLTSINLGGATHIGEYAFANCTSLSEVIGLEKVISTDAYAFYGCTSLEALTLTAMETVGNWAFAMENTDAGYTSVAIPNAITIGNYAFFGNNAAKIVLPATLSKIGDGAFADAVNLTAFELSADNETYFVEDSALYRYITADSYELVSYPAGKDGGKDAVFAVKEGTVKVQAYALAFLKEGALQKAVLPYSVRAIGDGAFYRSGILEYTFESVTAPVLEFTYEQDVVDYIYNLGFNTRAFFNVNFEECILSYSEYGSTAGTSPLKMNYPVNGVGYDNLLYKTYFGTRETTSVVMTDETRAAIELITSFPTVEVILALGETVNEETRASIEELSQQAKTARAYVNAALMDEEQAEYLGDANVATLESVETALRAAKKAHGITVAISRLSYETTSEFKQQYYVGETFEMAGLIIVIEYDDGSKETADLSQMTLLTDRPLKTTDSVVQLSGYGKEMSIVIKVTQAPAPENPDDGNEGNGGAEDSTPSETPDSSNGEESGKKGCGSVISSVSGLFVLAVVGGVLLKKRKEERE